LCGGWLSHPPFGVGSLQLKLALAPKVNGMSPKINAALNEGRQHLVFPYRGEPLERSGDR
jgi:hypothetical protein